MDLYRRIHNKVRRHHNDAGKSNKSPYHRQALESQEIRLLTINSKENTLSFRTVRHKITKPATYDAVSYVWGAEEASVTVPVDNGFLQITPRAYEMLEHLHLYKPVPNRPLWIDAICINQYDTEEKAVQIPLMHQIYSKATSVVVWFGPAVPQTLAFMGDFDRVKVVGREVASMRSRGLDPRSRGLILPASDHIFWKGLFYLLDHEWFRRLWTLQEILLAAPSSTVMLCGSTFVDFEEFATFAYKGYYQPGIYVPYHEAATMRKLAWEDCLSIRQFRDVIFASHTKCLCTEDISILLHRLRLRKATEEVDRVWAIFALLEQDIQRKLAPFVDYSDDGRTSYWKTHILFAKTLIVESQSLDLLSIPPSIETNESVPSWCPQLSGPAAGEMLITGHWNCSVNDISQSTHMGLTTEDDTLACETRRFTILRHPRRHISVTDDNKLLHVRGFVLDVISEIVEGTRFEKDFSTSTLEMKDSAAVKSFYSHALKLAQRTLVASEDPVADTIPAEFLMATFVDDRVNEHQETAYRDVIYMLKDLDYPTARQEVQDTLRLERADRAYGNLYVTMGQTFFATKGGRIGFSTPGCKPGNKVCVFYGCQPMYILQWPNDGVTDERGHAKFCGVAYIPHHMYPEQMEAVKVSEDEIFVIA